MDMRHYKEWIKIGLNILYYRKERRMTQQQLQTSAEKTGSAEPLFSGLRRGSAHAVWTP